MTYEIPNLTLLRQFAIVAEERGFSKAAKRLRISQPALSKNIRRLEETLGTSLFDRLATGAVLTPMGKVFLDRIQIIGLEYEHALEDMRNALSDQDATIRIGAGPIWTCAILPTVAERFHSLYPRHRLFVSTGSVETLGEDLRLGRIDIFAGALLASTTPKGFAVRNLARTDMVVLASEAHELSKAVEPVAPARLAEYPFVVFQPSRGVIEGLSSYLRLHNAPPPRILVETSSIYACMELVRTGKYLLYENRMITHGHIGAGVAIVSLADTIQPFDIGIVYREGLDRLPHLNRVIAVMTQVLRENLIDPRPAEPT